MRCMKQYLQWRSDPSHHPRATTLAAASVRGVFALAAAHRIMHHATHARCIDGDKGVATQQAFLQVVRLQQ